MAVEITDADEVTLIDYRELATLMKTDISTARKIVKSGDIPLVRLGAKTHRVRLADYKRYINRGGNRSDG